MLFLFCLLICVRWLGKQTSRNGCSVSSATHTYFPTDWVVLFLRYFWFDYYFVPFVSVDFDNVVLFDSSLSLFPSISSLIYFQADCVLCRITTKNLHDIPVSILAIVLELWLHVKSNVSLVQWILKLLQWPAILLYRMIDLPTFDCIEFM